MTFPVVWAVVVAGGTGTRFAADRSKLLDMLANRPILAWSVQAIATLPQVSGMILATHPQWQAAYQACLAQYVPEAPLYWVEGGATRRASVWNALQALPKEAEIVLVHDAARPLVKPERIQAAMTPVIAGDALGSSLGVPAQNSLKRVLPGDTPWVEATLERTHLWQVHTPQVFQKTVLLDAHQRIPSDLPINDDAELVERCFPGQAVVQMVPDDPWNLKITTPDDIRLAEALLRLSS